VGAERQTNITNIHKLSENKPSIITAAGCGYVPG